MYNTIYLPQNPAQISENISQLKCVGTVTKVPVPVL